MGRRNRHTGPVPYTVCKLHSDAVAGMIGRPVDLPAEVPDSWSVYFAVLADPADPAGAAF